MCKEVNMVTFKGNGVVWDKERNKVLCSFRNGEFKTDDKRVIDILLKGGYEHDAVLEEETKEEEIIEEVIEEKEDLTEKTVSELREIAKTAGHTGIYRKTKEELISMLEGD